MLEDGRQLQIPNPVQLRKKFADYVNSPKLCNALSSAETVHGKISVNPFSLFLDDNTTSSTNFVSIYQHVQGLLFLI